MDTNDALNAFYEGLLDEDGYLGNEDDCIDDDGAVDDDKLEEYMAQQAAADERKRNVLLTMMGMVELEDEEQKEFDAIDLRRHRERFRGRRKKRRKMKRQWYCDPTTGKMSRVCPQMSSWWIDYVENPEPDCPFWNKVFRQRFRLPYVSYIQVLEWVCGDDCDGLFDRWRTEADHGFTGRQNNKKVSPLELLLLGSLRYLGRGWTFDDIEEATKLRVRVCGGGFPGCIGSTDATHIPLDKVTAAFRQAHIGYKMGSDATTRTYNLTVNHRRQILHTTTGHPGRWNDKALIRFDSFMSDLRDGAFDEMVDFTLKRGRKDDTGTVTTGEDEVEDVTIKGAYVIVDNGYLRWPTTIPPMKDTCNRSELRFSQWLEALRKDVECTFGILKGRWRILKTGIRVHNTEASDNIWMTCCALHNHLLDVDGLSHKWDDGVPSSYENDDGEFQDEDIPAAIRRLVDPIGNEGHRLRTFDSLRFGFQANHEDDARDCDDDDDDDDGDNDAHLIRSGTSVKSIEFNRFRAMLIENFNIAFHEDKLKWPKRFAKNTKPVPILPG
ncbi:Plant transposon protein [Fragilaria crotonensis]|nr:Plant transposon protein [Fragilaria crotonensis]